MLGGGGIAAHSLSSAVADSVSALVADLGLGTGSSGCVGGDTTVGSSLLLLLTSLLLLSLLSLLLLLSSSL